MTFRPHISEASFSATFPRLIYGRHLLPGRRVELQMLLLSTVLTTVSEKSYTESEINELLLQWISRFGTDIAIDHATLRRYLVDESILLRDRFGAEYRVNENIPGFSFDPSIRQLDLEQLISRFEADRAARKEKYEAEARKK